MSRTLAGFRFSYVHILESLPDGEHTGRQLRTALETRIPGAPGVRYSEFATREDLFKLLAQIEANVGHDGAIPVLHLECHGSDEKDGLILKSGEFVPWGELWEPLARINARCALHVLMVLGACHGSFFLETIDPTERTPVWGFLSSEERFSVGEILDGFPVFYAELFASQRLELAIEAMRRAGLAFEGYSAEDMFILTYGIYLRKECSHDRLMKRAARLARRGSLPMSQALGELLKSRRPLFDEHRQTFFMTDLYPENDERFPASFDEVKSVVT